MGYLFPALSLLCTYGMVGCAYIGFLYTETPMTLILYGTLPFTAAVAVLCVINIVCAARACRRKGAAEAVRLCGAGMAWKLLAVPYFLLNFLAWTVLASAFLVVPGLQLFLLGLPLAVLATYLPLLTSSAYTIAAIFAARRTGMAVKMRHIVCQLLFILDTIDAVWLFFHLRRAAREGNMEFTKGESRL